MPFSSEHLYDRDNTGCIRVERHANKDGKGNCIPDTGARILHEKVGGSVAVHEAADSDADEHICAKSLPTISPT